MLKNLKLIGFGAILSFFFIAIPQTHAASFTTTVISEDASNLIENSDTFIKLGTGIDWFLNDVGLALQDSSGDDIAAPLYLSGEECTDNTYTTCTSMSTTNTVILQKNAPANFYHFYFPFSQPTDDAKYYRVTIHINGAGFYLFGDADNAVGNECSGGSCGAISGKSVYFDPGQTQTFYNTIQPPGDIHGGFSSNDYTWGTGNRPPSSVIENSDEDALSDLIASYPSHDDVVGACNNDTFGDYFACLFSYIQYWLMPASTEFGNLFQAPRDILMQKWPFGYIVNPVDAFASALSYGDNTCPLPNIPSSTWGGYTFQAIDVCDIIDDLDTENLLNDFAINFIVSALWVSFGLTWLGMAKKFLRA